MKFAKCFRLGLVLPFLLLTHCVGGPKVKLSNEQKTRLFSCKDPDLTKIAPGVTITLCNGTDAVGTMPSCSSNGQSDCFTNSTYRSYTTSGVDASKIRTGTTIMGIAGTLADCSSDGQAGCVTTSTFKSANTGAFTAFDVRTGITVAGVSGSIVYCKNGVDTGVFDNTTAPAGAGADIWDTIDDYANGGTFPATNPFSSVSGAICSGTYWQDVTVGGVCDDPTDDCVMRDRLTGLTWSEHQGTIDWPTAITTCDGLSFSGQDDWRLPTQKELMQAYIDGIASAVVADWITLAQMNSDTFWTATTDSTNTAQAYSINLSTGVQVSEATANTAHVICVRP